MATPPLTGFPRPLPWDVRPIGQLRADGFVDWATGAWPPEGATLLLVWCPGEEPAFRHALGRLVRVGRATRFVPDEGRVRAGWVVLAAPWP